jgi:hypothetical protein
MSCLVVSYCILSSADKSSQYRFQRDLNMLIGVSIDYLRHIHQQQDTSPTEHHFLHCDISNLFYVNSHVFVFLHFLFFSILLGTTQVFTNALSAMSPAGFAITPTELVASVDRSFYSQSTPSGPTGSPSWCGPSTGRSYFISCHYHTLFIISSTLSCSF